MTKLFTLLLSIPTLLASGRALADEAAAPAGITPRAPAPTPEPHVPREFPQLVLDTGRTPPRPPEPDLIGAEIHGEYQLRMQMLSSFLLQPSASVLAQRPGATGDSIGQNWFMNHWLRVTPRLHVKENIQVVGQLDLSGLVVGDTAHDTRADATPRDEHDGFKNLQPRWLYVEARTKAGLFRVGQQPSHWGMGLVANDGDHPTLFGDYRYGNIVEQVLFATKPFGKESPFTVAVAGNLVFKDNIAQLTRGDRAYQGVLAAFYEKGPNMAGVYGVYRHQERDRTSGSDYFPYSDTIDAGIMDAAAHFAAPILTPGAHAYVFGAAEGAVILGSTNALRTADQALSGERTKLRSYGGAAQIGFVLGEHGGTPGTGDHKRRGPRMYGKYVAQIEVGYASGDADPNDGTERRFVFDPNHRIGLLLFNEVLRFQTARAATAASDPLLQNGSRPTPGVDLLPSNGGVFGAQYVNPTMLYRPLRWLDLKAGMVVAQTTADVVDPYRLATTGAAVNYRGGNSARHDLGMELDFGAEARVELDYRMRLQLGAQGGVLFPGGALADASGEKLKTPWIVVGRAGIQF